MFNKFIFAGRQIFQSEARQIYFKESGASNLDIDIFEQPIDAGGEGHDSCVDIHEVFSFIDVVGDDLDGEIWSSIESIGWQEYCAYSFGILEMTEFESYVFF